MRTRGTAKRRTRQATLTKLRKRPMATTRKRLPAHIAGARCMRIRTAAPIAETTFPRRTPLRLQALVDDRWRGARSVRRLSVDSRMTLAAAATMTMTKLDLVAASTFGLEAVVARELEALGYAPKIIQSGRVLFSGERIGRLPGEPLAPRRGSRAAANGQFRGLRLRTAFRSHICPALGGMDCRPTPHFP